MPKNKLNNLIFHKISISFYLHSAFQKWTSLQFYSFKMKIKKFRQKIIKFILLTTQRQRCQGKTP